MATAAHLVTPAGGKGMNLAMPPAAAWMPAAPAAPKKSMLTSTPRMSVRAKPFGWAVAKKNSE